MLSTLDSDYAANKYLVPFFAALGCGGGNVKHSPSGNRDYLKGYDYKEAIPSKDDILELLKALYDTDSSTKNTVDLPNEFWFEGGSNVPRAYNASFDGLAAFISKYQTMIIADKSSTIGDVTMNSADVNKLATEGTRWSDPQINNPRVVEAMITNVFATAVASAKTIISEIDNNDMSDRNAKQNEGIYMVRNSAIIINEALNSYGTTVKTQNDNIASVFDTAWGMIPMPKNVSSTIVGLAKNVLKKQITEKWKVGGDYNNIKGLKDSYKEKYVGILSTLAADNNVDFTKNGTLISIFESALN